ncbi:MAG: hypothetical protein Fur006_69520 [Coleofasciculaceae cyanobacterium]
MNYRTITYQKVKNLGNYESQRLEITVELEPTEDPEEATKILMAKVNQLLEPPKSNEAVDQMPDFGVLQAIVNLDKYRDSHSSAR